jgi:hypothetical protein
VTTRSIADVKEEFLRLRDELAQVLGAPTVDMLIDRGITEIRAAHPIVAAIAIDRGHLDPASLDTAFVGASPEQVQTAMNALTAVMLLILARLMGKGLAHRLAEQLKRDDLISQARL